jgi:hypothetical protein
MEAIPAEAARLDPVARKAYRGAIFTPGRFYLMKAIVATAGVSGCLGN